MNPWADFAVKKPDVRIWPDASFIPWDALKGKTIFITGGTGIVGQAVVALLQEANTKKKLRLKLIILTRNIDRAKDVLLGDKFSPTEEITLIEGDVCDFPAPEEGIDYIIHAAGETASRNMVRYPIETIKGIYEGTNHMLSFARKKNVKAMVYLSSMEVYGHPKRGQRQTEDMIGRFAPTDIRNSYPIGKLAAEALCVAYAGEYDLPVRSIRLAQVIGSDFHPNDKRIIAYLADCVRKKQDIVLRTTGESERSYIHALDAATAILMVLLKGRTGEIYNVADEKMYASISELAEMVAKSGGIGVKYEIQTKEGNGFPKTQYLDIDSAKISKLGWKALWGAEMDDSG